MRAFVVAWARFHDVHCCCYDVRLNICSGSYAGSFVNAIPVVGPFLYIALKSTRTLLVGIPPGLRFASEDIALKYSPMQIAVKLIFPAAVTTAVAGTAFLLPSGFDWASWADAQLYGKLGASPGHYTHGWAVVGFALAVCFGLALVLAMGTSALVTRACCGEGPPAAYQQEVGVTAATPVAAGTPCEPLLGQTHVQRGAPATCAHRQSVGYETLRYKPTARRR